MIARLALAFTAGAACLWAGLAQAQSAKSHLQRVLEAGMLRVGTTGDFRPMSVRDPASGGYVGYDIEAANDLARSMGVKVEFVPADWKTLVTGVAADKYDIVMSGVSLNMDRARTAAFTAPYVEFGTVPIVQKAKLAAFRGWSDLDRPDVTVATTLGTVFDAQARDYFKAAKVRAVEAPAIGFQEVLANRADATITSNVEAAALVRTYPQLAIVPTDQPRNRRPGAFLVAQDDLVWLNYVNTWVALKKTEGFFDALEAKWLRAP